MYFYVSRKLIKMFPDPAPSGGDPAPAPTPEKPKENEKKPDSNVELAKAFKELKENSVSKEEYNDLKEENRKLVEQVINGGGDADGHNNPPEDLDATIKKLREELYGPKCDQLSNLEFCEKTLKLREAVIKKGDPDPFLPNGAKIQPDSNDIDKAENVAKVFKECIDEAKGNSEVFTAILQSKVNNDSPQLTALLAKRKRG